MSYLRNRPFMVVRYTYTLAPGQKTNTKDFMKTAEWEPVENMVIVDRVSARQMNEAELVLDLLESKVIKCRDGSLDNQELFDIFVKRHYGEVKKALALWIAKDPENKSKVDALVNRITNESKLFVIKSSLEALARGHVLDSNDPEMRDQLTQEMTEYLDEQDLEEFTVICDDTNNTQDRVDANELWADVAVRFKNAEFFNHLAIRIAPAAVENAVD